MFSQTIQTLAGLVMLFAPAALAAEPDWDPRLARGTLENGLTYILYDSGKNDDPFNIRLIVHAGSVDEPEPSGVAHILEHMVFQSNKAHPASMHRYFQDIGWRTGVQINAVTRETETQYMVRTRPNDALNLEASLALVSDLAFGAELKAEDWEKERFVILEELRQGNSTADRISRQKKAILRVGSRFTDRPTIGTKEGIEATSIEAIRSFYQRFYVASNMTLIVSGRIDTAEAKEVIERTFAKAPARPRPDRSYQILPLKDDLTVGLVRDATGSTSQVTYGFRVAMPKRTSDAGQFAYLEKYFLTRLIRDAVQAQADHYDSTLESLSFVAQEPSEERLILAFNTRTANHDAGKSILLDVVERLRREGLPRDSFDAEMANARRINKTNVAAANARTFAEWEDRIASAVLMNSVVDDPSRRAARTTELLDRVTFEGLNQTLRAMLASDDQVLFYQVPGNRELALPTATSIVSERRKLAELAELPPLPAKAQPRETPMPRNVAWPSDKRVAETGSITSERRYSHPAGTEWTLSNGDRVVWLERDTPDGKVYLSGQASPGYLNGQFNSLASQAALQLWPQSGYGFWSQDEYELWLKAQPASWSWSLQDGMLDIGAVSRPEQLPGLLKGYAAAIRFGTIREEAVQSLHAQLDDGSNSSDAAEQLLYATAPGQLSEEPLSALTANDLQQIAKAHLAQPVIWFAVGPEPGSDIRKAFAEVVGAVERKATLTPSPLLQREGVHEARIETFNDHRARVEMTFFSPMNWTPEAGFLISTLTPIAQQALKNELRNRLGGIYSLEYEMKLDPDTNRVISTLAFFCTPERTQELKEAALAVLTDMDTSAAQADVARLRDDIAFAEESRLNDPNTWLRRLALSYRRYGNAGYLERMQDLGSKVTAARLEAHARTIFRTDNLAVLTKLPHAAAEPVRQE